MMYRISLEKHENYCAVLKDLREELLRSLENYKTKKERGASPENKALKLLDELRSKLDDIAYRDYGRSPYY